jgi:histidine triad (HIT) family protein
MRDCVFCKIVRHEAPARWVAMTTNSSAFHPLNPVIPGHILVIPNQHVADFAEDPEVSASTMADAARLARTLGGDCNLITSKGLSATQSVFHLHIHLIPRVQGDQLMVPWGTTGNPNDPHRCKGMDARDGELDRLRTALAAGVPMTSRDGGDR